MPIDRTLDYDRQLVRDLYFSKKAFIKRQRGEDVNIRKAPASGETSQLSAKQYQTLMVCFRGLRIDTRRLSATLAYYHHQMLNTPFGLLKCEIKNFDDDFLSLEECILLDDALPNFTLEAKGTIDALDLKLLQIQRDFPTLKRDLSVIKYRLKAEQNMQKTCAAIVCCYHFILAFDEAYEGNLVPILHTVRSLGNLLNHGSYLGDARGFHLSSLHLLANHHSMDKSESLLKRLQIIVGESDIDYTPLRRFYARMIDPRDIHELQRQLMQSNNCLTEWLVLKDRLDETVGQESIIVDNVLTFRRWARTFDELIQDRFKFITRNVTRIENNFVKYDALALKKFLKLLLRLPDCENDLFGAARQADIACVELIYDLPGAGSEVSSPACRSLSSIMQTPSTLPSYDSFTSTFEADEADEADEKWLRSQLLRRLQSIVQYQRQCARWLKAFVSYWILRSQISTVFRYLDSLVDWMSAHSGDSQVSSGNKLMLRSPQNYYHVHFATPEQNADGSQKPSSYGMVSGF